MVLETILNGTEGEGRKSGMVLKTILNGTVGERRVEWDGSGDYVDGGGELKWFWRLYRLELKVRN